VAAGEVVVIWGSGLGPATPAIYTLDSNGLVTTNTGGVSVFFNGVASSVLYASPNQVNAVVPYGISGSPAQVFVQYFGQTSTPFNVSVATQIPGVFTLNGTQAAAINNADGTINGAAHPAKVGSYVQLYLTGAGLTSPFATDGLPNDFPPNGPLVVQPVTVTIGGKPATVQFAGGAPGAVAGVIQVNAQIPTGIATSNAAALVVQVGQSSSQPGVTLAVTN
jgi:uncharacterized protein (TIGR03437 family)